MAHVVVMPQLGNTVESCLITTWLVAVGDRIDESGLLCEIETDKSAMEVPAGVAGTVLALLAEEGDEVPVKDPLAIIGEAGEDISDLIPGADASASPTVGGEADASSSSPVRGEVAETGDSHTDAPESPASASASAISPRARHLAASQSIAADQLTGSGPAGRIIERDVQSAIAAGPPLTPGARTTTTDFLPGPSGTGLGGRVTHADLSVPSETLPKQAEAPEGSGVTAPFGSALEFPGGFTEGPLKGVRRVVAERMMASLAGSAQLTYTATAPAAGLLAMRGRLKAATDPELAAVTIGDLVGFATVKTLAKHAKTNSHLVEGVLRTFEHVHLGMAVDTPRGLLVPTLRFADTLSVRQFSVQSKELANQAIGGSINPDLLGGATFTVSNLGAFGIESFTPLLNLPQVAILGVDAIFPRAVIGADDQVGAEQRIGFSLTADHQVIDGADAARFLKDLCAAVAEIDLTVLG